MSKLVDTFKETADNIAFLDRGKGINAPDVQSAIEKVYGEINRTTPTLDIVSVKDFGAVGDGVTDDTEAISNAKTYAQQNNKTLYFPPGRYKVDPSLNILYTPFKASNGVMIIEGENRYDVSNSVLGFFTIGASFDPDGRSYLSLYNAKDGKRIMRIADGVSPGDSHVIHLPLDVRRDSHALIASPETEGGSTDIVFRTHAYSDVFYIAANTAYGNEDLVILFDTLPANPDGSKKERYAFDGAIHIPGNTTNRPIRFPALDVLFERGIRVHLRNEARRNIQMYIQPDPSGEFISFKETFDDKEFARLTRKGFYVGNTLFTTWGEGDEPPVGNNILLSNNIMTGGKDRVDANTSISRKIATSFATGEIRVKANPSGGDPRVYYAHFYWKRGDANPTIKEIFNTLVPEISVDLTVSNDNLFLNFAYTQGWGAYTLFDWNLSYTA